MPDTRYLTLSDIVRITHKSPDHLLKILPPPSLVAGVYETISLWSDSAVDAALEEQAERDVGRLGRERDKLLRVVEDLERTARDLKTEIKRMREEIRFIPSARDSIVASVEQGRDALWPWEPPTSVPERVHGVYRLIREGKTMYIGQSVDIMNRISSHATQKEFDQISYARVDGDRDTLNQIESALIIIERPPWNHSYQGNLTHPTGHGWTREEALAVLNKYRAAISDAERDAA